MTINWISTHALREEGDGVVPGKRKGIFVFLPTPSARRATHCVSVAVEQRVISTHALREEGDVLFDVV